MSDKVVLDTDFMGILLTSEKIMSKQEEDNAIKFFKSIFDILNLKPVIHEYIYEQELLDNELAKKLVDGGYIEKITGDDIFKTARKKQYMIQVRDSYKMMKFGKKELNIDTYESLLVFHEHESNLGEIVSMLMAMELKIPCFFSNDNGAKKILKPKIDKQGFSIEVSNVLEVFEKANKVQGKKLNPKMVKHITKKIEEANKKLRGSR